MANLLTPDEKKTTNARLAELVKGTALDAYVERAKKVGVAPRWELHMNPGSDTCVQLYIPGYSTLMKFYLKGVEACCAMTFMYNFTVHEAVPQEVVDFVLSTALFKVYQHRYYLTSNRLIINMVGRDQQIYDPLEVATAYPDPKVDYKPYWIYFQKHAARVNTMLMPNMNTGKIIHHMEVLFSPDYFKE